MHLILLLIPVHALYSSTYSSTCILFFYFTLIVPFLLFRHKDQLGRLIPPHTMYLFRLATEIGIVTVNSRKWLGVGGYLCQPPISTKDITERLYVSISKRIVAIDISAFLYIKSSYLYVFLNAGCWSWFYRIFPCSFVFRLSRFNLIVREQSVLLTQSFIIHSSQELTWT